MPENLIVEAPDSTGAMPARSASFNTMATRLDALLGEVAGKTPESPAAEKPTEPAAKTPPVKAEPKAAPKVEAKPEKTEAKPDVKSDQRRAELESTEGMSPKATEKFNFIKSSRDEAHSKATQFEKALKEKDAEIERLRKGVTDPAIIEENGKLKESLKTYQDQLRMANVERDPRFKAYFDGKISEVTGYVNDRLDAESAKKVLAALNLPDGEYRRERLRELMIDLDDFGRSTVTKADETMWAINREKQLELAKGPQLHDQILKHDQEKQAKQKAQFESEREAKIKDVLDKSGTFLAFQPKEGDDAHNAAVDGRREQVKAMLEGRGDPRTFLFTPVLAQEAIYLSETVIPSLNEKISKLEAQIASMTDASPKLTADVKPAGKEESKPKSFIESFMANRPT